MNIDDLSRNDWENLIDQWVIGKNAERDREIMKRRIIDGICYEPLAEQFDLSTQRVKAIVKSRRTRIFKHIK